MVSLLVSLSGALILAAVIVVPPALGRDSGVRPIQPGLLTIAPEASGVVTLGEGRAAQFDENGVRITNDGVLLFRTVKRGSPISALIGRVEGGETPTEDVETTLSNLAIERLAITPGEVTWSGHLTSDGERMPAAITVTLDESRITLEASVEGADAVVVHAHQELGTKGVPPALPDALLRKHAWWVADDPSPTAAVFFTNLGTSVALTPKGAARGVDLRRRGHTDLHIWSPSATLSVTSDRRVVQ